LDDAVLDEDFDFVFHREHTLPGFYRKSSTKWTYFYQRVT
jgi:hypothetical protein